MKDFEKHVEKLEKDAADCDLIAELATDESKRKTFKDLAGSYRSLAAKMRTAMTSFKSRTAANLTHDRLQP